MAYLFFLRRDMMATNIVNGKIPHDSARTPHYGIFKLRGDNVGNFDKTSAGWMGEFVGVSPSIPRN